jgi:hypothetical protein
MKRVGSILPTLLEVRALSEPKGPPAPSLKPFDVDAAIAKQLDKVAPGDHTVAFVLTGEKVAGQDARARAAIVLKDEWGKWDVKGKTYVEVGTHVKPTVGVEIILTK